jgi:hypothetical protein
MILAVSSIKVPPPAKPWQEKPEAASVDHPAEIDGSSLYYGNYPEDTSLLGGTHTA